MNDSIAIFCLAIPMALLGFATGWGLRDKRVEQEIHDAWNTGHDVATATSQEIRNERNTYRQLWLTELAKRDSNV